MAAPCLADKPTIYERKPADYPDALISLPGARNVRYYQLGGTFHLEYEIVCKYPAMEVIKTISDKLAGNAWKPLRDDWLNPGLPSSHVTGWTHFGDISAKPEREVHQWLADWENEKGELVVYGFVYQYERGKAKDLDYLEVIAIFVPTKIAQQEREWALEEAKHKKDLNK